LRRRREITQYAHINRRVTPRAKLPGLVSPSSAWPLLPEDDALAAEESLDEEGYARRFDMSAPASPPVMLPAVSEGAPLASDWPPPPPPQSSSGRAASRGRARPGAAAALLGAAPAGASGRAGSEVGQRLEKVEIAFVLVSLVDERRRGVGRSVQATMRSHRQATRTQHHHAAATEARHRWAHFGLGSFSATRPARSLEEADRGKGEGAGTWAEGSTGQD